MDIEVELVKFQELDKAPEFHNTKKRRHKQTASLRNVYLLEEHLEYQLHWIENNPLDFEY